MHKIDTPGSVSGQFTMGNPLATPVQPATQFDADWCNAIQNEIVNVILAAGATLDKSSNVQLVLAIQTLVNKIWEQTFGGVITFLAAQDYTAGKYYRIGATFGGVCAATVASGQNVTLKLCGYFNLDKAPGEAYTFGDKLYWDSVNEWMTSDSAGGTRPYMGPCAANTTGALPKTFVHLWSIHEG